MSPFDLEKELDTRCRIISEKNNNLLIFCVEVNPQKYYPVTLDQKYSRKHKFLYNDKSDEV